MSQTILQNENAKPPQDTTPPLNTIDSVEVHSIVPDPTAATSSAGGPNGIGAQIVGWPGGQVMTSGEGASLTPIDSRLELGPCSIHIKNPS
jgi:hypothetical protein